MVATERLSWVTGWAEASGQKSAIGGRAILQAVTRVKLEQASKVKSWMPTHQVVGEGRADREENRHAPVRSAGVMSTACKKGGLGNWGIPSTSAYSTLKRLCSLRSYDWRRSARPITCSHKSC